MSHAIVSWRWLFMHEIPWAFCFPLPRAGSNIEARRAMMAITTSNSTRVNPRPNSLVGRDTAAVRQNRPKRPVFWGKVFIPLKPSRKPNGCRHFDLPQFGRSIPTITSVAWVLQRDKYLKYGEIANDQPSDGPAIWDGSRKIKGVGESGAPREIRPQSIDGHLQPGAM